MIVAERGEISPAISGSETLMREAVSFELGAERAFPADLLAELGIEAGLVGIGLVSQSSDGEAQAELGLALAVAIVPQAEIKLDPVVAIGLIVADLRVE